MKIPETNANIGAYYGSEDNVQWQPNGVIVDSGVGGGVVGSGDAGLVHAPIYPVPRDPGYMMAAGYYSVGAFPPQPVPSSDDFADYMWMENEDEFDKQVMQQLEEEALMEQCIEAMLEDEQRARRGQNGHPTTSNGASLSLEEQVSRSTLNPLAAEFVPTFVPRHAPPHAAPQAAPPQATPPQAVPPQAAPPQAAPHQAAPQTHPQTQEEKEKPVEVSAKEEVKTQTMESARETATAIEAMPYVEDIEEAVLKASSKEAVPKERKEAKSKPDAKLEAKKTGKVEPRKGKPQAVRSEPKLPAKKDIKKEAKSTKSEVKLEETIETLESAFPVIDSAKRASPLSPPEEVPNGPKPINYAAAAKANKPKKASTPPATEKPASIATAKSESPITTTRSVDKVDKQAKTGEKVVAPSKDRVKTDKQAAKTTDKPRKNSAK